MCRTCHHEYASHDDPYTNDGCTHDGCECRHYQR
jgi:hypothetical protein